MVLRKKKKSSYKRLKAAVDEDPYDPNLGDDNDDEEDEDDQDDKSDYDDNDDEEDEDDQDNYEDRRDKKEVKKKHKPRREISTDKGDGGLTNQEVLDLIIANHNRQSQLLELLSRS